MDNLQSVSMISGHQRTALPADFIPDNQRDNVIYIRYSGESMKPTLWESDLLEVSPYEIEGIQIGDVIVFQSYVDDDYTVHRVIAVEEMGIRARGDNNDSVDPFHIQPDQVLGKAHSFWRGRKSMKLLGATSGLIWSSFVRALRGVDQRISKQIHPLYRSMTINNDLLGKLSKEHHAQIQGFESNGRAFYKVVIGKQVVGLYDHERDIWRISRPFRLFVDDSMLEGVREL